MRFPLLTSAKKISTYQNWFTHTHTDSYSRCCFIWLVYWLIRLRFMMLLPYWIQSNQSESEKKRQRKEKFKQIEFNDFVKLIGNLYWAHLLSHLLVLNNMHSTHWEEREGRGAINYGCFIFVLYSVLSFIGIVSTKRA